MKNISNRCRPFAKTAICVALSGGLLTLAPAVRADAISDLKAQIDALQKKVEELSARQAEAATRQAATEKAVSPDKVVTSGATKGSFKLPGSDTSVTISGFVKADAIYSNRSAGTNSVFDQVLLASGIPVGPTAGANEKKQITLHARQSRLNLKTSTPTAMGDLTTVLEGDFFGTDGNESISNGAGLRLRHAYGQLGGLMIGQNWTLLMDLPSFPEVVDFGGPVGEMFVRQVGVRWTQPFSAGKSSGNWAIALENPETVVSRAGLTPLRADDDRYPDIVGKIDFNTAMGHYAITGMARNIRIDTPASRDNKWGGVIGVGGRVPTFGKDDFRFSANYGNVLGRYTVGFLPDGNLDASGNLDLPQQWAAQMSYHHFWTEQLRSSLILGGVAAKNKSSASSVTNKNAQSVHLNLIWSPVKNTNFGLEYIGARREIENGQSGTLNRVQASAQYLF